MSKACVAAFAAFSVAASADTAVRTSYSTGGAESSETKILTKGFRQRVETGKEMSMVQQRDLHRFLQIDHKAKTYFVMSTQMPGPAKRQ